MQKTERMLLQEEIKERFAEKVESNREKLCASCEFWYGFCFHRLLPVTGEGKDCPYFRRKQ